MLGVDEGPLGGLEVVGLNWSGGKSTSEVGGGGGEEKIAPGQS